VSCWGHQPVQELFLSYIKYAVHAIRCFVLNLYATCKGTDRTWMGGPTGGVRDTGLAPSVSVGASNNIGFKDTTSLRLV
jgi:hypothetical protein